ncbi:MAG: aminoacetone oxidase family FAD-binding enzyme [Clostridiales bacterium]|nr:aminoacetone oxidase family FAD-binding enzyme [Clostridiales bacterium]
MSNVIADVAVIGGGASGLMLAANLDIGDAVGIVLEGSAVLGSKLLMSGGGHCNITHGGSIKDFINAYGNEGQALRRCLYSHSNTELMKWFEGIGIELNDEDGRVFPASMRARDILDALIGEAASNLWQIETGTKVVSLIKDDDWVIRLENGFEFRSHNVVIACGGITYPETGSDGSMHGLLAELGIGVSELRPALAPVYVRDYPYAELAGVSLSDVAVTAFGSDAATTCKGKAARMTGDILFTHDGFSGPAILNISKYAEAAEKIRLSYNKELEELPKRMQRILKDRARGESGDVKTKLLASLLDHDDFTVDRVDERGMVTAGGVKLDEIDMKTMQVKQSDGLYVIGEALDADGITGGYNLQMCWSTACTCADDLRSKLQ